MWRKTIDKLPPGKATENACTCRYTYLLPFFFFWLRTPLNRAETHYIFVNTLSHTLLS